MKRVLVTATIPFLAAVGIAYALFREGAFAPFICMSVFLLAAIVSAFIPLGKVKLGAQNVTRAALITALLFAALGFARVAWQIAITPDHIKLEGQSGMIYGTLKSVKASSPRTATYRITLTKAEIPGLSSGGDVIIYAQHKEDLLPGDKIKLSAECLLFTKTPTMDFERFYRERGVELLLRGKEAPELCERPAFSVYGFINSLSASMLTKVDAYMEQPYSGMLKAILLGDGSDFDDGIYRAVTRSGVNHLFTVSGLHVTTLSGFLLAFLLIFKVPRRLRAIIAIIATWIFVAITGFGVSACRSGVTVTLLMLGECFHRPADSLNSLCGAALLLVLANPACITQTSFLLTFSATAGMVLLQRPVLHKITEKLNPQNWFLKFVIESFATTAAVTIAMLPVLLPLFGGTSLLSPILNLLLVPLLPLILTVGIVLLAMPIEWIAVGIGHLLEILFALISRLCEMISALPFCYVGFDELYWRVGFSAVLVLAVLSLLLYPAVAKKGIRNKTFRPVLRNTISIGLAACFLTGGIIKGMEPSKLQVTTFGGRKGGAVLITVGKRSVAVALADDDRVDIDMSTLLQGKNLQRVDYYITLGEPPIALEDTNALIKQAPIDVLMSPQAELSRLTARLMPQRFVSLNKDIGYQLPLGESHKVTVRGEGKESSVWIETGKTRICITSGNETAKNSECDILFFGGDFSEIYKQVSNKYVILVKEPRLEIAAEGIWRGYHMQYELALKPDGSLVAR